MSSVSSVSLTASVLIDLLHGLLITAEWQEDGTLGLWVESEREFSPQPQARMAVDLPNNRFTLFLDGEAVVFEGDGDPWLAAINAFTAWEWERTMGEPLPDLADNEEWLSRTTAGILAVLDGGWTTPGDA